MIVPDLFDDLEIKCIIWSSKIDEVPNLEVTKIKKGN